MADRIARLAPDARAWFLAEIAYIAKHNPAAATKVVERFRAARKALANFPKLGPSGLVPDTRRFVVAPYVLTVQQRRGIAEITAIRHARQSDAYEPRDTLPPDIDSDGGS